MIYLCRSGDHARMQVRVALCYILHDGMIVENGSSHGVIANPQHFYTKLLIDASKGNDI